MATDIESYRNLIGGEWKVSNGSALENHNPADYREIVGLFPLATALVHRLGTVVNFLEPQQPSRLVIQSKAG